eukprot:TRINITY_DN23438_c0_g2_i2.p1 TRINITY_DN23438_c0_g2~~TRINITY_DN23438_c0_g2_i2.p1  ORF type:complete len:200 (-),score=45.57 TRINITY_DN23438_c0_g2_i2:89-688(-)
MCIRDRIALEHTIEAKDEDVQRYQHRAAEAEAALERERKLVVSMQNMLGAISNQVSGLPTTPRRATTLADTPTQGVAPAVNSLAPTQMPTEKNVEPPATLKVVEPSSDAVASSVIPVQVAQTSQSITEPQNNRKPAPGVQETLYQSVSAARVTPRRAQSPLPNGSPLGANLNATKKIIQDSVSQRLRSLSRARRRPVNA